MIVLVVEMMKMMIVTEAMSTMITTMTEKDDVADNDDSSGQ